MLTIVFLFMIAILAIAGIFIAVQAKRRSGAAGTTAAVPGNHQPRVQRATPDND